LSPKGMMNFASLHLAPEGVVRRRPFFGECQVVKDPFVEAAGHLVVDEGRRDPLEGRVRGAASLGIISVRFDGQIRQCAALLAACVEDPRRRVAVWIDQRDLIAPFVVPVLVGGDVVRRAGVAVEVGQADLDQPSGQRVVVVLGPQPQGVDLGGDTAEVVVLLLRADLVRRPPAAESSRPPDRRTVRSGTAGRRGRRR